MTNAIENPIAATCSEHEAQTLYSPDGAAALEKSDDQAGREYLPMDVFVDPTAMRHHFQGSSV
ncbi:MAG: hypothetical protein LJE70_01310 [Chromatiaceae bacterium]|jgi:hypothetical protein|nr:hypothetical protein [Chromatiaceae bacterium]